VVQRDRCNVKGSVVQRDRCNVKGSLVQRDRCNVKGSLVQRDRCGSGVVWYRGPDVLEKPTATFIKAEEFQVLHVRGNYFGGGTNKEVCD
jgi:hypothetical protein